LTVAGASALEGSMPTDEEKEAYKSKREAKDDARKKWLKDSIISTGDKAVDVYNSVKGSGVEDANAAKETEAGNQVTAAMSYLAELLEPVVRTTADTLTSLLSTVDVQANLQTSGVFFVRDDQKRLDASGEIRDLAVSGGGALGQSMSLGLGVNGPISLKTSTGVEIKGTLEAAAGVSGHANPDFKNKQHEAQGAAGAGVVWDGTIFIPKKKKESGAGNAAPMEAGGEYRDWEGQPYQAR
jgi:hypothetical protein